MPLRCLHTWSHSSPTIPLGARRPPLLPASFVLSPSVLPRCSSTCRLRLKSLTRKSKSAKDIGTVEIDPTKRDQRHSYAKQRRRRRQQQQHPRRSASSMAALPPKTRGKVVPVRDSAWQHSTYDGGAAQAYVSPREDRQLATIWYAQDESRRFIKGNIVKGALPPVQRTGLSMRTAT